MDYIAPKLKVMATEDDGKKGGGWSESGFDASIPVWDGRADSLREYKRTVRWWLSSVDLERTRFFNLAARFAMKQRGSARLCALEFDPKDLEYQPEVKLPDGETGDDVVVRAADYTCGVWKIIEAWENMVGRTTTDKRGELRDRFYTSLKRPPNESITAFALRYRTLIAEMRAEGIVIDDKEAAWFYKTKLGLSEMQKQMLETTLGADSEDYAVCERESIRLFKRVHAGGVPMQGPRKPMSLASFTQRRFDPRSHGRRPFSSAASTASSNNSNWSRKSPKSVNVTEQDDGGPEEDHYDESTQEVMESTYEQDDGDYGEDESLLQLQTEVECMAAELDELAEQGVEESDLAGLEETLDSAVEALVTMKEAKSQIASLKKDRGFKGPSKGSSKGGQDSGCFACGAKGHWKGDPACPKSRGKGSKDGGKGKGHGKHSGKGYFRKTFDQEAHSTEVQETNIVDFLAEIPVNEPEVTFDETVVVHEINVVESGLSEALAASAAGKQPQYLEMDKMYIAAVDSACNRSCAGSAWLKTMLDALEFAPAHIRGLVEKTEESERFRFGNGGILISRTRVRLPVLLLGRVVLVWINEIPCDSLGCLLGKDFMEALGTVIDFLGKKMLLKLLDDEKWIKLQKMKAGHFAVNLLPMSLSVWPGLRREPWVSVGTGSICEVQVESKRQWILNKLKTPKNLAHSELNVIEYYVPVDVSGSSFSEETFAPVPDVPRRERTFLPSMAQDGDQAVVSPELESQRTSALDGAARTSTVLAHSPTSSGGCGDLEAAGPGHGAASSVAEVLASEMLGHEELHADESQGVDPASRTARIGAILPGGWSDPDVSANVEEETTEGGRQSSPGRTTSTGGTDREPEEEADRRAYWAERRASKAQGRIARAMRAVQRRAHRGDDRGQPDREAQTSDRSFQRHRRDAPNSSGVGSSQSQVRGSQEFGNEAPSGAKGCGSTRIARHSREFATSSLGSQDGSLRGSADHGIASSDGPTRRSRSRARSLGEPNSSGGARRDDEDVEQCSRDRGQHVMGAGVRSRDGVLPSRHRKLKGEEAAESEALEEDEVLEAEETPRSTSTPSPKSRRSGTEPEPEMEDSPKKSIGKLSGAALKKLKPGLRQQIAQGLRKSQRLERALGASTDSVHDALETENDRVLIDAILNSEPLVGEVQLPVSEDAVREAMVAERGIKFLKKINPDNYPGNPDGLKDAWYAGMAGNWICRQHWIPRRRLYTPTTNGLVPYLPMEAFTGTRVTYVDFGANGAPGYEVWDNFKTQPHPTLVHEWQGCTWLELRDGYGPGVWGDHHFSPEERNGIWNNGKYTLSTGDEMITQLDGWLLPDIPMPSSGPATPISTFVCPWNGGGWQVIERKVPWDCRTIPRYCAGLCEKAASIVTIIHHTITTAENFCYVGQAAPSNLEPMVGEIFTDIEPVKKAAEKRGHRTMASMTLPGYDFFKRLDQQRCHGAVKKEKPFCLVVAFPCTVWSPLQRIGRNKQARAQRLRRRQRKEKLLVKFSVESAKAQLERRRHFIIENPAQSMAWKACAELKALAQDSRVYAVDFDQCMLGLQGPSGGLHRKRTTILTSSKILADRLRTYRCSGTHAHEPVIGGSRITRAAGHYPPRLANLIVRCLEEQLLKDQEVEYEALAAEADGDGDDDFHHDSSEDEMDEDDEDDDAQGPSNGPGGGSQETKRKKPRDESNVPSREQRAAVMRLHQNTGHRDPRRLARALVLAGASPEIVRAAKEIKCEVCQENRKPRAHRPSTLPKPRNFCDQVHMDLFLMKDVMEAHYWIVHAVDAASGFQVAKVLPAKTTDAVLQFLNESWISHFGAPRTLICDSGPEFISEKMQAACDYHDVVLYHTAVEAPWVNGIAERGGQSLKTIGKALSTTLCPQNHEEMTQLLAACLEAVNNDVGESGFSPAQMVLGKQPRHTEAASMGSSRRRLAQHSILEESPAMERRIAMKEAARVAMVRLKYSKSLRRAELARARKPVMKEEYHPGDLVYFFREQKPMSQKGKMRRRLVLKRWHGPALVLCPEVNSGGIVNAIYVAYRGNCTKVAAEHIRHATSFEKLAHEEWENILNDIVAATGPEGLPAGRGERDLRRRGQGYVDDGVEEDLQEEFNQEEVLPAGDEVSPGEFAQLPPLPGQQVGSSEKSGEGQSGLRTRFPFPYPMEATGSRRSSVVPSTRAAASRQVSVGTDARAGEQAAPANVPHLVGVPEKPDDKAVGSGDVQQGGVKEPEPVAAATPRLMAEEPL